MCRRGFDDYWLAAILRRGCGSARPSEHESCLEAVEMAMATKKYPFDSVNPGLPSNTPRVISVPSSTENGWAYPVRVVPRSICRGYLAEAGWRSEV